MMWGRKNQHVQTYSYIAIKVWRKDNNTNKIILSYRLVLLLGK